MMFLVSEVRPFADGYGRIARIMMNAELVAAGEERIFIPTIFRSNYLTGLKVLSNSDSPNCLIFIRQRSEPGHDDGLNGLLEATARPARSPHPPQPRRICVRA